MYCLKDHFSGDWRKIGSTLGIDYVKLNEIRDDKSRFLNNGQRLEEVLIIWREDKRFKHYEFTKDGLCSLSTVNMELQLKSLKNIKHTKRLVIGSMFSFHGFVLFAVLVNAVSYPMGLKHYAWYFPLQSLYDSFTVAIEPDPVYCIIIMW